MSALTVIIPTRDRTEKLRLTLDALRRQTEPDFETIVVLDQGEIVQQGTPERLLEEDGLYQRLCRAASTVARPQTMEAILP